MNSALKPVLPQPGVPQPGGQASPAKGNVANANHTVGLPQGAQNSLLPGTNNLVGQNLIHHIPNPPPLPAHAVPSMAPISANMAQMAQNMSHHGNLSHATPNSITPTNVAASPSKSATTSAPAPLSLVQDKPAPTQPPQPLALTRTPEKKEPDSTAQANGAIDSPKTGSSAPAPLKPQNPETKDKPDIAKTSPSTPKPPEKPVTSQNIPQKAETSNTGSASDPLVQPKVATANEPPEKSPSKPIELKSAQTADVAPTQSDNKPTPESANENQVQASTMPSLQKESLPNENPKPEPTKSEENGESPENIPNLEGKVGEQKDNEDSSIKSEENKTSKEDKTEEKSESKTPVKSETKVAAKSTLKLATVTPMRKRRQASEKSETTPAKKPADESTPDTKSKRNRTKVQLYQSPTPEIAMATKLSASAGRSTPTKQNDDKLIVFYKNEYLAVRNAEGGFYVCQALQNVYRTTRKIKIRWLSQDKGDPTGETYKPDFYDVTDMECVLTTLSLTRSASGGGAWLLRPAEQARATSILQRALKAEHSGANIPLTEEHPDGLDLSLYTDESQLEKKSRKRSSPKSSPNSKEDTDTSKEEATPSKKARTTPKRSPRSAKKRKSPKSGKNLAKAKSSGSTPSVAVTSKVGIVRRIYRHTATAVSEKSDKKSPTKKTPTRSTKATPAKTSPAKTESPVTRKGRKAAKEAKSSPIVPTPSTSTGKTTRTPRKPPSKK
ncbi:proteoglycan 4-like isoform X1 [Pieris napi]|uniref:proteoglycan 4-like isoform X1 n=3 Tax=Pieris napi TaxID=78633 RepID=UPI001FBB16F6|nr:proteoglycan 4-like isoform X1 [Pieris napi]